MEQIVYQKVHLELLELLLCLLSVKNRSILGHTCEGRRFHCLSILSGVVGEIIHP